MRLILRSLVEIIGPPLHHLPALRQVLRVIVGGANLIAFVVRKLPLYHVRIESVFIQDSASRSTETVPRCPRMVAHSIQRIENGVLTHAPGGLMLIRRHEFP